MHVIIVLFRNVIFSVFLWAIWLGGRKHLILFLNIYRRMFDLKLMENLWEGKLQSPDLHKIPQKGENHNKSIFTSVQMRNGTFLL